MGITVGDGLFSNILPQRRNDALVKLSTIFTLGTSKHNEERRINGFLPKFIAELNEANGEPLSKAILNAELEGLGFFDTMFHGNEKIIDKLLLNYDGKNFEVDINHTLP